MKADLTRNTFKPFKHYSRVLMQQGRVQLDADWNEQSEILLHYLRSLAVDLIGPAGGPAGNCGFVVQNLPTPVNDDFALSFGHYYVDGLLCEVDSEPVPFAVVPQATGAPSGVLQVESWSANGTPWAASQIVQILDASSSAFTPLTVAITAIDATKNQITLQLPASPPDLTTLVSPIIRRVVTYLTQPDYNPLPFPNAPFLIYLDVWERHITYIEDNLIREVALLGPDTATRSRIVWQVKAMTGQSCLAGAAIAQTLHPTGGGRLKARAKQSSASSDPCIIAPNANYSGPENQLYRVEINHGGAVSPAGQTGGATFKFSRENGCVTFPIVSGGGTNSLVLASLGRDDRFGLSPGDIVEVQDDASVLANQAGNLLTVQSIDRPSATVTLTGTPDPKTGSIATLHPLLRRWDQKAGDPAEGGLTLGPDKSALIQENVWLDLENGVEIFFESSLNQPFSYRTGDYWLIPARTVTADVEWPRLRDANGNPLLDSNGSTIPLSKPPDGIIHHYAPLAVVVAVAGEELQINPCIQRFPPMGQNQG
jgi:hypothetical protein